MRLATLFINAVVFALIGAGQAHAHARFTAPDPIAVLAPAHVAPPATPAHHIDPPCIPALPTARVLFCALPAAAPPLPVTPRLPSYLRKSALLL